jgi:hypothetical protein
MSGLRQIGTPACNLSQARQSRVGLRAPWIDADEFPTTRALRPSTKRVRRPTHGLPLGAVMAGTSVGSSVVGTP